MKILRLDLLAYGHFSELALDLSAGTEGVHLIYGPNEAGKSTALRALRGLFYGIETRTADGFLHENENLRIGAVVRHSSGETLDFIRRKGTRNTFLDRAGNPADDALLRRWLSAVDEPLFTSLFGIDHARLRAGGEGILRGGGDVGESLFAAGLGGGSLRAALQKLDEEANDLFLPQGQKPAINRACKEYAEAKKQIGACSLLSRDFEERQAALAEARSESARVAAELQTLRGEASRLQRLARALPLLAPRAALRQELAAHGDITALLARAATVAELHGRLGAHRKAALDLPELKSKLAAAERDEQRLVKELRAEGPHHERGPAPLTRAQQNLLQQLASREQAVLDRAEAAALATKRAAAELKVARENLTALGIGPDAAALRRAVAAAQKEGDLEREFTRADAARAAAGNAPAKQLRKLQPPVETLELCEELVLPTPETAARFEKEWDDTVQRGRTLADRLRDMREQAGRSRRALDELLLGGAIPSEADLAAARAHRDTLWRALRSALAQAGPAELEAYAESVGKADALADALRRDAERVARQAHLELQLTQHEAQAHSAATELQEHEHAFAQLQAEWQKAWAPLVPLPPREMAAWRREHARVLEQIQAARDLGERRDELGGRVYLHRDSLRTQLAAHGVSEATARESLTALLERAISRAEQLDHLNRQRATLTTEIGKLTIRLETARAEEEQAATGIAKWREEWHAALRSVAWPETAAPAEAIALIACSTELQARAAEAESLRARIHSIESEAAAFLAEASALCAELAPELSAHPAEEAVVQLHSRIAIVQARRAKLDDLEDRLRAESAGASLEDFLRELETLDADTLAAQVADNETEIDRREKERAIHDQHVGEENALITSMDGNARALEAAERAQSLRAQIEEQSERYLRLTLGAAILRREIERYRAENQDPLLRRAADFFRQLTLGSFASITTDFDANDNPILKGVRASGQEIGVEGMSEGTRDQLFLALQLASVEKFIAAAEPMPFIVDDILIAFDHHREAAVLSALAELSRKTQVILFTHHTHLVELAERHLASDVLRVHRLPERK